MAKRKIRPPELLSSDMQGMFDVLNDGSDVAAVLAAAAFIDASLGSILETKFLEGKVSERILDETKGGFLGSYAARADLCYVLNYIPKSMYMDILKIAQIRNVLAHSHMALSFSSPEISKLAGELSHLKTIKSGNTDEPLIGDHIIRSVRDTFVITTVIICQQLVVKGLVSKRKRSAA